MLSQTPHLIVIDEYPSAPAVKPFLNPICKGTYEALPKIYGRKGKKRYLVSIQDAIKNDHSAFHRDCCHLHSHPHDRSYSDVEQKRSKISNNLAIADPKSENCKKKTCPCNKSLEKLETEDGVNENAKPQAKLQKIILPALRDIDEIKQSESKHKVYHLGNNPTVESHRVAESRFLIENRYERLKELKQSRVSRSEYIQTDPQKPFSQPLTATIEEEGKAELRASAPTQPTETPGKKHRYQSQSHHDAHDPSKPYYEYLENDPRLRYQSDKAEKTPREHHQRHHYPRRANTSEDQNLSISSFTIKNQQSVSTVFHQFKKKQSSRNSNIQSQSIAKAKSKKSQSLLSNGLFKIPEADEYENFLSNYAPMNPEFDLKGLIKQHNFHIVPADTYVYFGQVQDQKKHGEGIFVSEREIYEGTYDSNAKVGGFERNRDGVYSGEFLDGRRSGQGRFVWNNGEQFEGEWREGRKNGWGTWRSPRGDSYEGEWRDNRQNGKGYFVHAGSSKYRGYFRDFLKHGKGEEEFANGDKYSGTYEMGKPHGYGKYSWANGDAYEGEFADGSREGRGVLRKADGQVYEGEFKNDLKHGQGQEKYKSGEQFVGEFSEGERVKGKLRTKNGAEIMVTSD